MNKETFDFSEALRRMKQGKKVRRKGWENQEYYVYLKGKDICEYNDLYQTLNLTFRTELDIDDYDGTDWEEVEV